jgi:hypothetical protein
MVQVRLKAQLKALCSSEISRKKETIRFGLAAGYNDPNVVGRRRIRKSRSLSKLDK